MNLSDSRPAFSILLLALARDCEPFVPHFGMMLEQITTAGIAIRAIVGENGSRDRTRQLLMDLSRNAPVSVEDVSFLNGYQNRLERLARGREYLRLIGSALVPRPDFVCVADLDDVIVSPKGLTGLRSELERLDESTQLFAVSATSMPHYYDVLAYQDTVHRPEGLETRIMAAKRNPFTYYSFIARNVYDVQESIQSSAAGVTSAFNGLAFYKAIPYFSSSYVGEGTGSLSEHVVLNRGIAAATGLHMGICNTLVMNTPADHRRRSLLSFWGYRLGKYARRAIR